MSQKSLQKIPDISPKDNQDLETFLSLFPESIFCYIPEGKYLLPKDEKGEQIDKRSVFHSPTLDFDRNAGIQNDLSTFHGLYFSVNGFRTDLKPFKRTQSHLTSLNALYVDIDRPKGLPVEQGGISETDHDLKIFKNEALKALTDLDKKIPLSALVETKRGFHAYFRIGPPVAIDPSESETPESAVITEAIFTRYSECLNELRLLLKGDPAAKDACRVLRVPFSLYHKTVPITGEKPFRIALKLLRPNQAMSLDDYHIKLVEPKQHDPNANVLTLDTDPEASLPKRDQTLIFKEITNKDLQGNFIIPEEVKSLAFRQSVEALQQFYPKHERPSFTNGVGKLQGIPNGERNHTLLIAASILREAGKGQTECELFFPVYNGLSTNEIAQTIRSAFRPASPYSFGWNDSILSQYVDKEEKHKVRSVVSDFVSQKIRAYVADHRKRDLADKESRNKQPVRDELFNTKEPTDMVSEASAVMEAASLEPAILTTKEQKDIVNRYPDIFCKDNPWFRVLDYQIPIRVDRDKGVAPDILSEKDFEVLIFQSLRNLGSPNFETTSQVNNQSHRLIALPFIQARNGSSMSASDLKDHFRKDGPFIPLKNGILDLASDTLLPYDDEVIFLSPVAASFIPDEERNETHHILVNSFLDSISSNSSGRRDQIEALMGYTLLNDARFQTAFILIGGGSNGKSTFTDALGAMLGYKNTLSFDLKSLSKNFFLSSIHGKRLGVVEEIESNYFESDIFKKIVSGGSVSADRKFLSPIDFVPYMKIVMSVNSLPKINDTSHGLFRRLILIPFEASFEGTDKDILLRDKLSDARDAFLFFALRGLRSLLKRGSFPPDTSSEDYLNDYRIRNTPSLAMFDHWFRPMAKDNPLYQSTAIELSVLFKSYQSYCSEFGFRSKALFNFIDEIESARHPVWTSLRIEIKNGRKFLYGAERRPCSPTSFTTIK